MKETTLEITKKGALIEHILYPLICVSGIGDQQ